MEKTILPKKNHVWLIVGIMSLGLVVLFPSFLLHFDGDSYLTLWRYQFNVKQNSNLAFPFISTFFTDYGPQDTIFALLYNIFGFQPIYFYTISFIFRLCAAFSLYPLLFYLTKNKNASYFSVLFFLVTPVGLETTNWVFNMPSYLGIAFLNIFLLLYLKLMNKASFKHFILSIVMLFLLIIIQPIRMIFIFPLLVMASLITLLFKNTRTKKNIFLHISYIILFLLVFTFGNIGDSVGVKGSPKEKITGTWINNTFVGTGGLSSAIKEKNYKFVYYYIGQLGNIVLPDSMYPKESPNLTSSRLLLKYVFPMYLVYCIFTFFVKNFKKYRILQLLLAIVWTVHIWWIFYYKALYPAQIYEIMALLAGGYFLITTFSLLLLFKNKSAVLYKLNVGFLIILFSILIFWVRSPMALIQTNSRYLIVGAAGLSILVGLLYSLFIKEKVLKIGLFLYLFLCMISSYTYLNELYKFRGYTVTENIRSSLPEISQFKQTKESVIVYIHGDNEQQLYHSLYFGFPVMMHFYQGVSDIWNIAYTTEWKEVASAYQTGEGFRRFGTMPIRPANIEYVFSFELVNNKIINTTQQTRAELIKIPRL